MRDVFAIKKQNRFVIVNRITNRQRIFYSVWMCWLIPLLSLLLTSSCSSGKRLDVEKRPPELSGHGVIMGQYQDIWDSVKHILIIDLGLSMAYEDYQSGNMITTWHLDSNAGVSAENTRSRIYISMRPAQTGFFLSTTEQNERRDQNGSWVRVSERSGQASKSIRYLFERLTVYYEILAN